MCVCMYICIYIYCREHCDDGEMYSKTTSRAE